MATLKRPRIIASAVTTCGLLALMASPAVAVKILEREYVPAGMTSVVHIRVDAGCDGAPTDGLEVSLPDSLSGVIPEAVPGWTAATETIAADTVNADGSSERVSTIRWSGGSLPDGQFLDFGFRARFPDEVDSVLTFPAIQSCGEVQLEWTRPEGQRPAPFVRLDQPVTEREIADLVLSVEGLLEDVARFQEQIGAVNVTGLRDRVVDLETAGDRLSEGLANLRDRLKAVEAALPIGTDAGSQ